MINIKLEAKDILQVNATIITGILILLTISNFAGTYQIQSIQYGMTIAWWIGVTILPFTASSLIIILGSYSSVWNNKNENHIGRKASLIVLGSSSAGFLYLIWLIVILSNLK